MYCCIQSICISGIKITMYQRRVAKMVVSESDPNMLTETICSGQSSSGSMRNGMLIHPKRWRFLLFLIPDSQPIPYILRVYRLPLKCIFYIQISLLCIHSTHNVSKFVKNHSKCYENSKIYHFCLLHLMLDL